MSQLLTDEQVQQIRDALDRAGAVVAAHARELLDRWTPLAEALAALTGPLLPALPPEPADRTPVLIEWDEHKPTVAIRDDDEAPNAVSRWWKDAEWLSWSGLHELGATVRVLAPVDPDAAHILVDRSHQVWRRGDDSDLYQSGMALHTAAWLEQHAGPVSRWYAAPPTQPVRFLHRPELVESSTPGVWRLHCVECSAAEPGQFGTGEFVERCKGPGWGVELPAELVARPDAALTAELAAALRDVADAYRALIGLVREQGTPVTDEVFDKRKALLPVDALLARAEAGDRRG